MDTHAQTIVANLKSEDSDILCQNIEILGCPVHEELQAVEKISFAFISFYRTIHPRYHSFAKYTKCP
jgi:hypothetical protein